MTTPLTPQDVLLQLLADPATVDRMAQDLLEQRRLQQEARAAFVASPIFRTMVDAVLQGPHGEGFDSENLAYFPDEVIARVWQGRCTAQDAERLLDVLGHPSKEEVPAGARTSDPDCPFFNERYTFHGLEVSILSGQGTIVAVSNG